MVARESDHRHLSRIGIAQFLLSHPQILVIVLLRQLGSAEIQPGVLEFEARHLTGVRTRQIKNGYLNLKLFQVEFLPHLVEYEGVGGEFPVLE